MSKAFTKDDANDDPLVVPARAPLPEGVANYVTARGLAALRAELAELEAAHAHVDLSTSEGPREAAAIAARVEELGGRIAAATVVDAKAQPHDEIRFGARTFVKTEAGDDRVYRIVGVDEADAAAGLVAFTSPLARALLGKRVGETAVVRTPRGEDELEIVSIDYADG